MQQLNDLRVTLQLSSLNDYTLNSVTKIVSIFKEDYPLLSTGLTAKETKVLCKDEIKRRNLFSQRIVKMYNNNVVNGFYEGIVIGIIYSVEHIYGCPLTVKGKETLYEILVNKFGEEDAQYWLDHYNIQIIK